MLLVQLLLRSSCLVLLLSIGPLRLLGLLMMLLLLLGPVPVNHRLGGLLRSRRLVGRPRGRLGWVVLDLLCWSGWRLGREVLNLLCGAVGGRLGPVCGLLLVGLGRGLFPVGRA